MFPSEPTLDVTTLQNVWTELKRWGNIRNKSAIWINWHRHTLIQSCHSLLDLLHLVLWVRWKWDEMVIRCFTVCSDTVKQAHTMKTPYPQLDFLTISWKSFSVLLFFWLGWFPKNTPALNFPHTAVNVALCRVWYKVQSAEIIRGEIIWEKKMGCFHIRCDCGCDKEHFIKNTLWRAIVLRVIKNTSTIGTLQMYFFRATLSRKQKLAFLYWIIDAVWVYFSNDGHWLTGVVSYISNVRLCPA